MLCCLMFGVKQTTKKYIQLKNITIVYTKSLLNKLFAL